MLDEPNKCDDNLDQEQNFNLHLAFILIQEFYKIKKRLPRKDEDIKYCLNIKTEIIKRYKGFYCELNENFIYKIIWRRNYSSRGIKIYWDI